MAAERASVDTPEIERIVVEIKSFLARSALRDLYGAVGQYAIYREMLGRFEPERVIYLAVRERVHDEFFSKPAVRLGLDALRIGVLVVNVDKQEIVKWTKRP